MDIVAAVEAKGWTVPFMTVEESTPRSMHYTNSPGVGISTSRRDTAQPVGIEANSEYLVY